MSVLDEVFEGCFEACDVVDREGRWARVRELTDGEGVPVVYDSVGKATFDGSLDCLKPRGCLALFGFASGPVPAFDPVVLGAKGSLYLTRPGLPKYIETRAELLERACGVAAQQRDLGARDVSTVGVRLWQIPREILVEHALREGVEVAKLSLQL